MCRPSPRRQAMPNGGAKPGLGHYYMTSSELKEFLTSSLNVQFRAAGSSQVFHPDIIDQIVNNAP